MTQCLARDKGPVSISSWGQRSHTKLLGIISETQNKNTDNPDPPTQIPRVCPSPVLMVLRSLSMRWCLGSTGPECLKSWSRNTDRSLCVHSLCQYSAPSWFYHAPSALTENLLWNFSWQNQFSSVPQSCPTLCDPMNRSTSGLHVDHHLPEFTQTQVHQVGDAIQPSHPLSSSSPPAPNPSQHQSLFQWVISSHEVAKVLEFQL